MTPSDDSDSGRLRPEDTGGLCVACRCPWGSGSLLDFHPNVPVSAPVGITQEVWERFAARYRCPVCAGAVQVP